jgi:serine/threonine protein kinase
LSSYHHLRRRSLSPDLWGNFRRGVYCAEFHKIRLLGQRSLRQKTVRLRRQDFQCRSLRASSAHTSKALSLFTSTNIARALYTTSKLDISSKFASSLVSRIYESDPFDRVNSDGELSVDYQRSIFLAEYEGKAVLVKVCERYGEEAHRTLPAVGLASVLHFCSLIVGDIFVVVMDQVDGRDASKEFKGRNLPSTVPNNVKLALEKLHDTGFVHGDLRRPNIMVHKSQEKSEEEWRGLLVDFDWARPVGETNYPGMLNRSKGIIWADGPDGVTPGNEIKKGT